MVRNIIVNFLLDGNIVGYSVATNSTPIIPRIGEEVRIHGMYLKVIRIAHLPTAYTVEVHLSR